MEEEDYIFELQTYFQEFADKVVDQSRAELNLAKEGSTNLGDSIRSEVVYNETEGKMSIMFYMLDYGTYVNQGVSGNEAGASQTYTNWRGEEVSSDFAYSNKMPPVAVIEEWVKKKGIKGRKSLKKYRKNKTGTIKGAGQFIKSKSLAFAISKSIQKRGIKSTSFFTKPFGNLYSELKEGITPILKNKIQDMYFTTFTKF
jgi:hypothetical protein|tara:strand:- start:356 stop:955 length:600 start_codon:yes stop_codon:yes gene_type:complete